MNIKKELENKTCEKQKLESQNSNYAEQLKNTEYQLKQKINEYNRLAKTHGEVKEELEHMCCQAKQLKDCLDKQVNEKALLEKKH